MGILGAGIGAFCGNRWGILGALIGGVIGSRIEDRIRKRDSIDYSQSRGYCDYDAENDESEEEECGRESLGLAVLSAIAALLAKIAKADGRVSAAEINYCEKAFVQLNLNAEQRKFCIKCFNKAKNDAHSACDYARDFSIAHPTLAIREIVYDILWNLAAADNELAVEEIEILREIPKYMRISDKLFEWQCSQRGINQKRQSRAQTQSQPSVDPYAIIGCSPNASDDEVRKAYREKSKSMHPDILRSKGLPEELIQEATRQMTRINAAWNAIKKERNLR